MLRTSLSPLPTSFLLYDALVIPSCYGINISTPLSWTLWTKIHAISQKWNYADFIADSVTHLPHVFTTSLRDLDKTLTRGSSTALLKSTINAKGMEKHQLALSSTSMKRSISTTPSSSILCISTTNHSSMLSMKPLDSKPLNGLRIFPPRLPGMLYAFAG